MFRRCLPLLLVSLLVSLAGCGGSDSASSTTGSNPQAAALLDRWSETSLAALAALQRRAKAATERDKAAYDKASAELQRQLGKVSQFPQEARTVTGSAGKVVGADAAAWKVWADLLSRKTLNAKDGPEAGRLGAAAAKAHLAAYKAAGAEVPADFRKQAGGG